MNINDISIMVKPLINQNSTAGHDPEAGPEPDITDMLKALTLFLDAEAIEKRKHKVAAAAAAAPVGTEVPLPQKDYVNHRYGTAKDWADLPFAVPNYYYINILVESLQNLMDIIKK